jgi:DMSO/TMAO reductase YedYZ molybdopterin-dependent catalytic subunit
MNVQSLDRRAVLSGGAGTAAVWGLFGHALSARAFPMRQNEEIVPWADRPPENPVPQIVPVQLDWERFDSWITPVDQFFGVGHYGWPEIDSANWRLDIGGLVRQPMSLDIDAVRARPRQEVTFTLECAGNNGLPFLTGAVGNARWAGTPLAPILEEAGIGDGAVEIVFFGADSGVETFHDVEFSENFARSMTIEDAMKPEILLAYEMNGEDLPMLHGHPLRVIAPGWYGVANVKWLNRIEARPRPYEGRFMAQDYVTLRSEERNGATLWTRNSVGPNRLKSVTGRVTLADGAHRITGAAWGAPIEKVEVRIDDGDWREASLDHSEQADHAWTIWSFDWTDATSGEHTITARATDSAGDVQPAPDDPVLANKHTYWESNGQVTRHIVIG